MSKQVIVKTTCPDGDENLVLTVSFELTENADGTFEVEALCPSAADFCETCGRAVEKQEFLVAEELVA